jgi:Tfp pilus assembly protein PilZ
MSVRPRLLRIEFSTEDSFRCEYVTNVINGGIFVVTEDSFDQNEPVRVEIVLAYSGECIELEGEVVHCIGPELAATGATPGVAVQFDLPAAEIRRRLEPECQSFESAGERSAQAGRRVSPRATARVPARLRVERSGEEFEVRTRNLSASGVLISAHRHVVPVGEAVCLVLTNPANVRTMKVAGTVVRHVEADAGQVTALGIEFHMPEARQSELVSFVNEVKAAEHSRRMGGITGPIAELGIENLLQMFGTCATQGTFTVTNGAEEGRIAFEKGSLVVAELGGILGRKALARMMAWREGSFEFEARVDDDLVRGEPVPLAAAILQALCNLDDSRRIDLASLPDETPLRVLGLGGDLDSFSKTEAAILDLADVGLTVGKVINVIPEPDAEVYAAISGLIERGLVDLE